MMAAFALGAAAAPVRPAAAPQGPRAAATASAPAAEIDRLLAELADARYSVRREAGLRLIDAGWSCVPALRRAYHETRSHEVRLRIREIAEAIYIDRLMPTQSGFLGIRQRPWLRRSEPRVPEGTCWIEVLEVFRDTAADRAGLRLGDVIVRCDGRPIPEDPTGRVFSAIVSRQGPGAGITLEVQRGEGAPILLKARLGRRPMSVLAESDPEAYAAVRARFDEWWREEFTTMASQPATQPQPASRPAR